MNATTVEMPFAEEFKMQISIGVVVMILSSIFGTFINSAICIIISTKKNLQTPFELLCFSYSLINLLVILLFAFWCLPMTILGPRPIFEGLIGIYIGQFAWFLWFVYVWSHLLLALNRFLALLFPVFYIRHCTRRNTIIGCMVVYLLGCGQIGFLNSNPTECYFTFDERTFVWNFGDFVSPCAKFMQNMDAANVYVTLVVCFCLDVLTLHKLTKIFKNKAHLHKEKKEVWFFMQSLIMGVSLLLLTLQFHFFTIWMNEPIHYFWLTTVSWVFQHMLDGIIVLSFNREMRNILLSKVFPKVIYRHFMSSTAMPSSHQDPNAASSKTARLSEDNRIRPEYLAEPTQPRLPRNAPGKCNLSSEFKVCELFAISNFDRDA